MLENCLRNAPLPTFERYKKLFFQDDASATRILQYEMLSKKIFQGTLLDFGGGDKARYKSLLNFENYESVNIDPAMEPTWITKIGEKMPCPANNYNSVVSMNTIEHIYDARDVIEDIYTVLKPGGEFVCSIPFLYPVHAHPDDFFRPTASWWLKTLERSGFQEIKITPLLWGPFTTGMICSGAPGPFRRLRKHLALLLDLIYVRLRFPKTATTFEGTRGQQMQNHALGYFIEARKP